MIKNNVSDYINNWLNFQIVVEKENFTVYNNNWSLCFNYFLGGIVNIITIVSK